MTTPSATVTERRRLTAIRAAWLFDGKGVDGGTLTNLPLVMRHVAAAPLDEPIVAAVDALAAALVDEPAEAVTAIDEHPLLLVGPGAL
jgi:hypothetical protein